MTHQTDVDVLIVGAGPTGLTLACLLQEYGVKFRILEKNKSITTRSKALAVQARTLELFEKLGLAQKAIAQGHPAEGLDLIVRGKRRATLDLSTYGVGLTKYPYLLILEQCKTEQLLWEKLKAGQSDVEWNKEMVELQLHADSVTAVVRENEKLEFIQAKYLVAADGARSAVRTLMHMPFQGATYENRFMLADVEARGDISRLHITLCLSQKGFAGFFPMYGSRRFRALGILPEDVPENADQEFAMIAQNIKDQAQVPLEISDPRWISTYKLHHRSVTRFKEQRCFFAGDAAHVHSPAGGQGMNTGIQDAFNLAWKIFWVLEGGAREQLLETYHEERFPLAKKLLHSTDRAFTFVTGRSPLLRFLRLYLLAPTLRLLTKSQGFRSFVFKTISQIGIQYRKSQLSEQCFVTNAEHKAGDRLCGEAMDGLFQAYVVGGQQAQLEVTEILQRYFAGKIKIYTLDKKADIYSILQPFGITKDGLILVRPDGYVSYCADAFNSEALRNYLKRFFVAVDAELKTEIEKGLPLEDLIY